MRVEISPTVYLVLCGLVRDAMEVQSDAEPLLRKAAVELASAMAEAPDDIAEEISDRAAAITDMGNVARAAKKSAA